MRKIQSTNAANFKELVLKCPISFTISVIGGRWKPLILDKLIKSPLRYGELKKSVSPVTERMLTIQLKELEADGLISRIVLEESVPKIVEYRITEKGLSLQRVLVELFNWGKKEIQGRSPIPTAFEIPESRLQYP